MRAPRWAVALTATGVVGGATMALALPGAALADDATRFNLTARADAFYFQVDGDEIPASPKNDAGSATASVSTNNSGGSKSFAGAPFYGNTVQTLPGTINGVPNQFGAAELQIPFAQLPGYVAVNSTEAQTKKSEEGQYYRVAAEALQTSGKSSAFYGAPAAFPAPNQQQTATAETKSEGSNVVASAFGSSQGIVTGPLEIANSSATATISQVAGEAPKIESKTFGKFAVAGQEFGFDQSGFKYLGQGQSSEDAVKQANEALKAANIQLALAPVIQEKTDSGGTRYTIGGLMVTTTQDSPSGAGKFTFTYIIGRASISADVAKLGLSTSAGTEKSNTAATTTGTTVSSTPADTKASSSTGASSTTSTIDSLAPADLAEESAAAPTTVSTLAEDGSIASTVTESAAESTGDEIVQPSSDEPLKTLGFVQAAQQNPGGSSMLLYMVLVAAGAALVGGPFLFSRFAVVAKG
ncbi:MAG: hypothetical protein ACT4QG_15490 [Sporichthyaceae bacterium]